MPDTLSVGDTIYVNKACPFEQRTNPVWVRATIVALHDTNFEAELHSGAVIRRFYAHAGTDWRRHA